MTSFSTDPSSATAVWFPRARTVEFRDEPLPLLQPGDVRIETIASAISHGTEMLVFRGQVPPELELDLPTLRGDFAFPIKYGYACVGRVLEAGVDSALRPGQPVFVLHPHQTRFVVPASLAVTLPDTLDPLLGVFLANCETAVNIMLDAAPRLGETVAVFGQGVVGLLVTQLLRRAGVGRLIAVDPIDARRELAHRVGADVALPPAEALALEADVSIEVSGNVAALQQAIDCLAFGGTVVVCSWYGTKPVALQLGGAFHRRRPRVVSSQVGSIDAALQPRWSYRRRLELARDLLSELELASLVSHRFALARAAEAYELIDQRPEETVQVVLTYG
ncbi:MAG TPA: zinc-binding alcohol dehydrogenase [Chloroflexota bacterium]|jgi:2-desacetyl-2-hydroxyethyl bacteriochlorophyllide A dehydrogenase|nr:zinc-binding alcohol dehydrogenase [Chloroflexota bacterium]